MVEVEEEEEDQGRGVVAEDREGAEVTSYAGCWPAAKMVRRRRPLLEWHQAVAPNFICKSGGEGKTLFLYIYSVLLFIQGAVRGEAHLQVL